MTEPRPAPAASAPAPALPPRAAGVARLEWLRVAGATFSGALAGLVFEHPALGAATALGLYLALYLRRLGALRAWLERPKHRDLPEVGGLWGEVFDRLLERERKQRRKRKRLGEMLAEFQASTAALPDGAVVLGAQGEIAWFNHAAQTLLGLSSQDIGLRVANLVRHPAFTDYLAQQSFEREVEAPSPTNRHRTLSLRIIPYGSNQRLLIVRDVSELRRLETARRDFVANASHELRTPLTVLRGYVDLMAGEAEGRGALAEWRGPLAEMRNQALRMEALVSDMLRLARLEADTAPMREETLDLPRLLARLVDEARALSAGQHRFDLQAEPGLLLEGGESELLSIVANLLSNAVRYTPAGGAIRVGWLADGDGARLSVADTGIGIAEEDIPRLTERFYRVDVGRSRASGGTGLGLSIVKHALERFDAQLRIESEPGAGSTFSCHFPAHRLRRAAPAQASVTADGAADAA